MLRGTLFLLSLWITAVQCRPTHSFTAFVQHQDPTLLRRKPLNMTRKAKQPPRDAWTHVLQATQEWDVERYQQQHSFVWEYGSDLLNLVTTPKDDGTPLRILDVGCGSGELTAQLAERTQGQVVGLDADPAMVQAAQERFPDITFVQADVRDFDVSGLVGEGTTTDDDAADLFDVIFSNAALHWVPPPDVDRAVTCLGRALKPGGQFVVEFGGQGNVQSIVQALEQRLNVESPWYYPSIADFTTRLESVGGMETTLACLYDRPTPLSDGPNGLRNWVQMFGKSFFKDLPAESDLNEILSDIEDEVRPLLWDGEIWRADYRRIRVVGRKL